MTELDTIIRTALARFMDDIGSTHWRGRENEAVNLFTFRYLVPQCREGSILYDPAQLGIECTVPQVPPFGVRKDPDVRKDLLIWPRPGQTCWGDDYRVDRSGGYPLAVIEWKVFNFVRGRGRKLRSDSAGDIAWLEQFTRMVPDTLGYPVVGYTVAVEVQPALARFVCSRVEAGATVSPWLASE